MTIKDDIFANYYNEKSKPLITDKDFYPICDRTYGFIEIRNTYGLMTVPVTDLHTNAFIIQDMYDKALPRPDVVLLYGLTGSTVDAFTINVGEIYTKDKVETFYYSKNYFKGSNATLACNVKIGDASVDHEYYIRKEDVVIRDYKDPIFAYLSEIIPFDSRSDIAEIHFTLRPKLGSELHMSEQEWLDKLRVMFHTKHMDVSINKLNNYSHTNVITSEYVTKYKCHINDRLTNAKRIRTLLTSGHTEIVREKHEIGIGHYASVLVMYYEVRILFDIQEISKYLALRDELKDDKETSYFISTNGNSKGWLTARFSNLGPNRYNHHIKSTLMALEKRLNLPYLKVEAAIYDTNLKYDEEWLSKV